jgi:hypothetical protein
MHITNQGNLIDNFTVFVFSMRIFPFFKKYFLIIYFCYTTTSCMQIPTAWFGLYEAPCELIFKKLMSNGMSSKI